MVQRVQTDAKSGLRPGAPQNPAKLSQPKAPTTMKAIPSNPSVVPVTQKTVVPGKPGA
jgi:hypothetical protein